MIRQITTATFLIIVLSLCVSGQSQILTNDSNNYIQTITNERITKDAEFRDPLESPIEKENIINFNGLNYFEVDSKYRVIADLILETTPDTIQMKTTTERLPLYIVYGKAYFTINGIKDTLTVFRNIGLMTKAGYEDYLFIPFTDDTSGEESYGGGRYIDSRITSNGTITLDFNRAYNPYCTYNKKYSCPIPPAQNHINTRIPAGEKKYKD